MAFLPENLSIYAIFISLLHLTGILLAGHAVWKTRTDLGATAWAIFLVSFPYLAIPLYLVFGRGRFAGYVRARRSTDSALRRTADVVGESLKQYRFLPDDSWAQAFRVIESLSKTPFTIGNDAQVLTDKKIFDRIFELIEGARNYVLIEFFTIRDDAVGTALKNLLLKKAKEGVSIFLVYDEIGSKETSPKYWKELRDGGVKAVGFHGNRGGWKNRLQVNFRNHRKIVVVDGKRAVVGGANIGDEYLGKGKKFSHWRDTQVEVTGPIVSSIQLCFIEDWHFATDNRLEIQENWKAEESHYLAALTFPSGPADDADYCALMFAHLIHTAKKRLWISSPYFVPDDQVLSALQLAALRGVDVKVLLPNIPDHKIVYYASFSYIAKAENFGVQFYRYLDGFPHQKVVFVDDEGVMIGTANLDNRSFRLNFEISLLFAGKKIGSEVFEMLKGDFAKARQVEKGELLKRSYFFQAAVRFARLISPIL